jgi:outer membrane protein assembly factor BamB
MRKSWLLAAVVGAAFAGSSPCNAFALSSSDPAATPILHHPVKVWQAKNPGTVSQGGPYVSYEAMAVAGNVIIGITFSSESGSLLIRLNPKNGRPLWTIPLTAYPEQVALAIRDERILLIAPGEQLKPSGIEGEGPGQAYAFSLEGAKLWSRSLGVRTNGSLQGAWMPPALPTTDEKYPDFLTDFDSIPGVILLYEGTRLRGLDAATGSEWSYTPAPAPERIFGPNPGGPEQLHLVRGADEVLIDGLTGVEQSRDRLAPTGQEIGLLGPIFHRQALERDTRPRIKGIGSVFPKPANAGNVVYAAKRNGLVAINTETSKALWTFRDGKYYDIDTAVAGQGFVLASDSSSTFLLRERHHSK